MLPEPPLTVAPECGAARRPPLPRAAPPRTRGFGLVEVLVTLAIASIGLLGHALLLQHCLASESAALRRTQATALLATLAERVRQNAAARAAYVLPADAPAPALPACAAGANCSPAETAALDLSQWLALIAAALPAPPAAAAASVDLIADPGGTDRVMITLRWAEPEMNVPATLSLGLVLPQSLP